MSDCPFCGDRCIARDKLEVVFVCLECLVEWPAGRPGDLRQYGFSPMSKMAVVHSG